LRAPLQVGHSHYEDFVTVRSINQAVWKLARAAPSQFRLDLLPGTRELSDPSDCSGNLKQEISTESWNLRFLAQLGLGNL
jgi:hypothetical protein